MGNVDLFEEFKSLTAALDGAGIDYAVIGGLAVAICRCIAGKSPWALESPHRRDGGPCLTGSRSCRPTHIGYLDYAQDRPTESIPF